MSTLAINTISGQTAANSVVVIGEGGTNTTSLQQGLVKAWVNFTGVTTTTLRDSFNVGSFTDIGTGKTDITYTNAMLNDNYSGSYYTSSSASTGTYSFNNAYTGVFGIAGSNNRTTTLIKVAAFSTGAFIDSVTNDMTIVGDLA